MFEFEGILYILYIVHCLTSCCHNSVISDSTGHISYAPHVGHVATCSLVFAVPSSVLSACVTRFLSSWLSDDDIFANSFVSTID